MDHLAQRIVRLDGQVIVVNLASEIFKAQFRLRRKDIVPTPEIDELWEEISYLCDHQDTHGFSMFMKLIMECREEAIR